jgi:UDP-N-acetyl-D-glucosamine dehydrogenase
MNDRIEKLATGPITVGVVGLGYVGLPLCMETSGAGLKTIGFDVDPRVVDDLNSGCSHIGDVSDVVVAARVNDGLFEATADMSRLGECDTISICVPTPLSKTRDPDVSYVIAAADAVAEALTPGQLVVLESTTYPGTTREVMLPRLEREGLQVGVDFFLCFSPERVDPGNEQWKTHNTPKVIGGLTDACTQAGVALYSRFIATMVPVSSAEAAEMVKILENTFRAVNIGLVNELALIANRLGVDVWEVIDAAATKPFGFMKFTPGPGLGGHCIPVDPHYLAWKMKTLDFRTRFIELASEINSGMPRFVTGKIRNALNAAKKAVNGSRVLVLGVAYKPDVSDVRESPAIDVIRLLQSDGAEVAYHDPFVPELRDDSVSLQSIALSEEGIIGFDAVVIVTDHSGVPYDLVVDHAEILVDARNVTGPILRARGGDPGPWIVKGHSAEDSALGERG